MVLEEDLAWCLSELSDLNFEGCALDGILQLLEIDSALVCYGVEHIVVLNRALINSEDEVDPVVDVL